MKIGQLVLTLRNSNTSFDLVGGAAEYALATEGTLKKEAAFIIPLAESAPVNEYDTEVNQVLTEQFAVVVAVKNSVDLEDKTGVIAYNRLHQIRNELFDAFLGLDIGYLYESKTEKSTTESLVYYRQGQLLDINRAFLWYQFTFEYKIGIKAQVIEEPDGFLDKIWVDYVIAPDDENLPVEEKLPIDLFAPDMTQYIDFEAIRNE